MLVFNLLQLKYSFVLHLLWLSFPGNVTALGTVGNEFNLNL